MCEQHLNSKIISLYLLWAHYMDPILKSYLKKKKIGRYLL